LGGGKGRFLLLGGRLGGLYPKARDLGNLIGGPGLFQARRMGIILEVVLPLRMET